MKLLPTKAIQMESLIHNVISLWWQNIFICESKQSHKKLQNTHLCSWKACKHICKRIKMTTSCSSKTHGKPSRSAKKEGMKVIKLKLMYKWLIKQMSVYCDQSIEARQHHFPNRMCVHCSQKVYCGLLSLTGWRLWRPCTCL